MEVLFYFFIATLISYIASLQVGPVNLRVIQCTIQHNKKYAFMVGLGGSMPEILYCGTAFYITSIIQPEKFEGNWLGYITLPVFLFLAIINFTKKEKKRAQSTQPSHHHKAFTEGFLLAMLNPQLITFWLMVITFFRTKGWLIHQGITGQVFFVLGSAVGALLLQVSFIAFAERNKQWIEKKAGAHFNKIIGGLFLVLALVDIYKLIKHQL